MGLTEGRFSLSRATFLEKGKRGKKRRRSRWVLDSHNQAERKWDWFTHIRHLVRMRVLEDIPQHIHRRIGLDGNTRPHVILVNKANEFFGASAVISGGRARRVGGCGGHSGFVVEGVEIAAGFLEVGDPSLGLDFRERGELS